MTKEKTCWYCVHYRSYDEGEGYANSILCEKWGIWGEGSTWYSFGRMSDRDDEDLCFALNCPHYKDEDVLRATQERRQRKNESSRC